MREDVEETLEIEKRKSNLVFHGVKKFCKTTPDEDCSVHDIEMNGDILRTGFKMDPSRHIEEMVRIGTRYDEEKVKDGKIRPIRVKVKTAGGRSEMLRRAKDLKGTSLKNVYIAPDLTRKQQSIDKDLREKLKAIRNDAEEGKKRQFRIKSGKIIKNEKGKPDTILYQSKLLLKQ